MMNKKKQTIAFYTQGCRLNQSETANLEQQFQQSDFTTIPYQEGADVVVVNTCTVTENGDADTRRLVNKLNRINPNTKIALIGCQAQILKEKLLDLRNVEWVVGNADKMSLNQIITSVSSPSVMQTPKMKREPFTISHAGIDKKHTRANLKIQDGCDFYCSFCLIPFARGPARSRVFDDIIRESVILADAGHQEVVLTGINLGTYCYEDKTLLDVIGALEKIDPLKRIRISSIEPTTIPKELISWMINKEKVCRYLHIPLQSGSDTILAKMSRKYNMKEFRDFVQFSYDTVPDICIGTDVIVGFPGETKAHFDETVANLMTLPIHYYHVFSYSERSLARSRKMDDPVSVEEIAKRSKVLRDLSQRKKQAFMQPFIDRTEWVLFEQEKHGYWTGVTDHYIRVKVKSEHPLENTMCPVRLKQVEGQAMIGELE